jgi:hypothetical protein
MSTARQSFSPAPAPFHSIPFHSFTNIQTTLCPCASQQLEYMHSPKRQPAITHQAHATQCKATAAPNSTRRATI